MPPISGPILLIVATAFWARGSTLVTMAIYTLGGVVFLVWSGRRPFRPGYRKNLPSMLVALCVWPLLWCLELFFYVRNYNQLGRFAVIVNGRWQKPWERQWHKAREAASTAARHSLPGSVYVIDHGRFARVRGSGAGGRTFFGRTAASYLCPSARWRSSGKRCLRSCRHGKLRMRGDEARVRAAFISWLQHEGWTVRPAEGDLKHVDVLAFRGNDQLRAR